ncbi:hypothetical protein ABMY26_36410 (plasmid) [Azospirillum sp. HJ39]|uniref:hypothetical protein n=1 Tax=Azospirillum sp. HJ39 TaxID=3159496 RepID=UPI003557804C
MEALINGGCHTPNLRRCENFGQEQFSPKRNSASARIRQNDGMSAEQEERDRLRAALMAFYKQARSDGTIRSVRAWVTASKIGYNTLNDLIAGKKNKRLEDETYFALAVGASDLLGRKVTVAELQGVGRPDEDDIISERDRRLLAELRAIGDVDERERDDLEDLIRKRADAARTRQRPGG